MSVLNPSASLREYFESARLVPIRHHRIAWSTAAGASDQARGNREPPLPPLEATDPTVADRPCFSYARHGFWLSRFNQHLRPNGLETSGLPARRPSGSHVRPGTAPRQPHHHPRCTGLARPPRPQRPSRDRRCRGSPGSGDPRTAMPTGSTHPPRSVTPRAAPIPQPPDHPEPAYHRRASPPAKTRPEPAGGRRAGAQPRRAPASPALGPRQRRTGAPHGDRETRGPWPGSVVPDRSATTPVPTARPRAEPRGGRTTPEPRSTLRTAPSLRAASRTHGEPPPPVAVHRSLKQPASAAQRSMRRCWSPPLELRQEFAPEHLVHPSAGQAVIAVGKAPNLEAPSPPQTPKGPAATGLQQRLPGISG